MSNEPVNANKSSLAGELGVSLGMSAAMTRGFGSLSSIRRNRGIKNAINQTRLNNDVVKTFLEKAAPDRDGFTRSLAAAKNYEIYSKQVATEQQLIKKLEKLQKRGKPSILQRLLNPGKSSDEIAQNLINKKVSSAEIKAKLAGKNTQEVLSALKDKKVISGAVKSKLESGTDLADVLTELKDNKVVQKGLKRNAGSLFKEELLNPLNLIFTGLSALGRIKDEALPAFKNEGFVAGVKKTLKVTAKTVADVVSNAGFSAAFRTLGSRVGMVFGPVGAAAGGLIGDIVGSFVSNKIIVKAFGEDKAVQHATQDAPEQTAAQNMPEQTAVQEVPSGSINNGVSAQTMQPRKSRYIRPQNGICATQWVNEAHQNGTLQLEAQKRGFYA